MVPIVRCIYIFMLRRYRERTKNLYYYTRNTIRANGAAVLLLRGIRLYARYVHTLIWHLRHGETSLSNRYTCCDTLRITRHTPRWPFKIFLYIKTCTYIYTCTRRYYIKYANGPDVLWSRCSPRRRIRVYLYDVWNLLFDCRRTYAAQERRMDRLRSGSYRGASIGYFATVDQKVSTV